MPSITTQTGDDGQSGLLFGARLSKTDGRFGALGSLDELVSVLGIVRAATKNSELKAFLKEIQATLISLGAEAATLPKDFERGKTKFLPEDAPHTLHEKIKALEALGVRFAGFELPGEDIVSAHLHLARAIARRTEREFWALFASGGLSRKMPCLYLNRLSDLLWLLSQHHHE